MLLGTNRYKSFLSEAKIECFSEAAMGKLLNKTAAELRPSSPCIFLSHKSEDKTAVKKIGEYIQQNGIDIYLDAEDIKLQDAVKNRDHQTITKSIELGIKASTDIITIISEKTKESWWVPYEIGFGKANGKTVAAMKLKEIPSMPSFLIIARSINGVKSLDAYLAEIIDNQNKKAFNLDSYRLSIVLKNNALPSTNSTNHPLANFLN